MSPRCWPGLNGFCFHLSLRFYHETHGVDLLPSDDLGTFASQQSYWCWGDASISFEPPGKPLSLPPVVLIVSFLLLATRCFFWASNLSPTCVFRIWTEYFCHLFSRGSGSSPYFSPRLWSPYCCWTFPLVQIGSPTCLLAPTGQGRAFSASNQLRLVDFHLFVIYPGVIFPFPIKAPRVNDSRTCNVSAPKQLLLPAELPLDMWLVSLKDVSQQIYIECL